MIRKVYFSNRAAKKLESIFTYLENNWTKEITNDFILKIEKSKTIVSKYPNSFPESKYINGLHKCVVTKHNTFYYRYNEKEVEIVSIFDNRQDPKKIKKSVKR